MLELLFVLIQGFLSNTAVLIVCTRTLYIYCSEHTGKFQIDNFFSHMADIWNGFGGKAMELNSINIYHLVLGGIHDTAFFFKYW